MSCLTFFSHKVSLKDVRNAWSGPCLRWIAGILAAVRGQHMSTWAWHKHDANDRSITLRQKKHETSASFCHDFFTQIPTSSKPGQTVNLREQFVQAKGRASTRSAKFPSMFHLSLVAPMALPRRRIVVVHHFLSNSKANEVWRTFLHPELHQEHVWSPHHSLQEPELFLQMVQRNCQIAVASVYAQTPRLPSLPQGLESH